MNEYTATEQAYKNGYRQGRADGIKELAERIKRYYSKSLKGETVGVSVYYYVDVIAEEMLGECDEKSNNNRKD